MEQWIVSDYPDIIDVVAVQPLTDFKVHIKFSDHSERDIDLAPYLRGPAFELIRTHLSYFRQMFIDHGAIAWPNGADIDTDTLYYDGEPPWA
jgi:hypothetical protein